MTRTGQGIPYRFGYPFEVEYNMNQFRNVGTAPDGGRVLAAEIECPGAYSINLVYRYFWAAARRHDVRL